jgi:hypothetical protein
MPCCDMPQIVIMPAVNGLAVIEIIYEYSF